MPLRRGENKNTQKKHRMVCVVFLIRALGEAWVFVEWCQNIPERREMATWLTWLEDQSGYSLMNFK